MYGTLQMPDILKKKEEKQKIRSAKKQYWKNWNPWNWYRNIPICTIGQWLVLIILQPSIEPTATGHIVEQIEMIKKIIADGYAYEANGSVYFDVEKYNTDYL